MKNQPGWGLRLLLFSIAVYLEMCATSATSAPIIHGLSLYLYLHSTSTCMEDAKPPTP